MPKEATQFKPGQSGNPAGGPRKLLKPGDLEVVTKLAAKGVREKDIARAVGMSEPTWQRLKADFENVRNALDAGRQRMHDSLVGKLYERAMAGETVPLLFLLKTRFGYREGDELGDNARPQVIINLPAPMSAEQYEKVVQHVPPALPVPADAEGRHD
jgi:hypothetical protein